MVFNATFNNISAISWWSILLVEDTRVPGENHQPAASHWQTLLCCIEYTLHVRVGFKPTTLVVIGTDCIGNNKSNHHMIMTTMALIATIYIYINIYNYFKFVHSLKNIITNMQLFLLKIQLKYCWKWH
jgi:hypothetical protein